jgi:hypothetical protein
MMRKLSWVLGTALVLLMAAPAFPSDVHRHGGGGKNSFFGDGDPFDLSELADGETRYFGPREREVAVTRTGDEVVMTLTGDDGEQHEIKCNVAQDGCFMLTSDDDDRAAIMIMSSERLHGHGEGEFLFTAGGDADIAAEGERIVIRTLGAGDNEFFFGDHALHWEADSEGAPGHRKFIQMLAHPGSMVRCPEGDTTMRLEKDESAQGYYCPRHNLLMEEVGKFDVRIDLHEDDE